MAKTGCIVHPKHSRVALLREEYMRLCDGNACAAMVLSQMEYWHDVKLETVAQAEAHNDAARRSGEEPAQDTELWVYKSLPEMKAELMGIFGDKAISAGFALLIEREYLEWRTNPRFSWDRTRQYRFNASHVQADLDRQVASQFLAEDDPSNETDGTAVATQSAQAAELPSSKAQNCDLEAARLPRRGRTDAPALPETTPKGTYKEKTLNVQTVANFVAEKEAMQEGSACPTMTYLQSDWLDNEATRLAAELHDRGSERRHRQLLSICEQHGLQNLPKQALRATHQRLDKEKRRGVVEKPGAYYQRILVTLLEQHQVFVPTVAERNEEDPAEVRRLARLSLGLAEDAS